MKFSPLIKYALISTLSLFSAGFLGINPTGVETPQHQTGVSDSVIPAPNPLLFSSGPKDLFPLTAQKKQDAASANAVGGGASRSSRSPISPAPSPINVLTVDTGFSHTCAVTDTGGVKCWGSNGYYQLGDGTMNHRSAPVEVIGLSEEIEAVTAAWNGTCALTVLGGVKCWGATVTSGDGTVPPPLYRNGIKDVVGLSSGVKAIDAGASHVCALMDDGGVKCWGSNEFGQLGDGSTEDRYTPVDVSGLSANVIAIEAGEFHTCAITFVGGIKCWGRNSSGELGDGTQEDSSVPVDVDGFTGVAIGVAAGASHTCGIKYGGGVMCWGLNLYGQIGAGEYLQLTPVDVDQLAGVATAIAAGTDHTCALLSTGGVQCWGRNTYGAVGDGTFNNNRITPVDVVGLNSGAVVLAGGHQYTCAATSNGGAMCWGWNQGRLGDGTGYDRYVPVSVIGLGVKKWTVMAYVDGDNNLEAWSVTVLDQMGDIGSTIDVNIIAQLDRIHMDPPPPGEADPDDVRFGDWDTTKRFYVTKGMDPTAANQSADLGEENMGDGQTLQDFIEWGMTNYPAERYALILQDHGSGAIGYTGLEKLQQQNIIFDDTSPGGSLDMLELRDVLNTVTSDGAHPIDVLGMDACLMGGIEVDDQISPYVKVRVSSQEIAYTGDWSYSGFLADLVAAPDMQAMPLAQSIFSHLSEYIDTYSVVDLGAPYDTLVPAVNAFGSALLDYGDPYLDEIRQIREEVQDFGYYRPPDTKVSGNRDLHIDLYHFAQLIHDRISVSEIHDAATDVMNAVDGAIPDGFEESDNHPLWPDAYGISIYFPKFESGYDDWYDGSRGILTFTYTTLWDEWLHEYYDYLPEAPGAFGKTAPNNGSHIPTSIILSWSASSGADEYEYCYDTVAGGTCDGSWISTGELTGAMVIGLEADKTYYWQVRAINNGGVTDADGYWWIFITTPILPGAFGKASPLDGSTTGPTPTISWSGSSGADEYEVCYDALIDGSCTTVWESVGSSTSFTLPTLSPSAVEWQVRALNESGTTYADGGTWWSFTTSSSLPEAFGKILPEDDNFTGINPILYWEESSTAAGYEYCYDTIDNGACDASWISAGLNLYAEIGGLPNETTYYWQVRGVNAAGNTEADGGAWWSFTTHPVPGPFGKLSPADGSTSGTDVTISWEEGSIAYDYQYCYDTNNNGACDTEWVSNGLSTSAGLSGLATGTTYYWQVREVGGGGITYADGGAWWSFTASSSPPNAFGKTSPANGSFALTGLTISWGASSNASEYQYCLDTVNNGSCDASWISTGVTPGASLSGLGNNDAYYWQVRAANPGGTTYADGGTWWRFTARNQTFADVPINHSLWPYIEAFYSSGITGGCGVSPLIFCPENPVTRAAMAVFLLRAKYGAAYAPPSASHFFSDLPVAGKEWQEAWVDQLYSEGITGGCGTSPLRYCPENPVTRAAMAVFILRAKYGSAYTPPAASHFFADMPIAGKEWMEPFVDQAYREGITTGCGTGPLIFCPETSVKRQAMAAFIVRAFNLPLP